MIGDVAYGGASAKEEEEEEEQVIDLVSNLKLKEKSGVRFMC